MKDKLTNILMWLICALNFHKDRFLALRLRELANKYDPRPRDLP